MTELSSAERAIVDEEEALLRRALASIDRATVRSRKQPAGGDLRSIEALRALRDEARTASEDDLPGILHEMSVRQRLGGTPRRCRTRARPTSRTSP